MSTLRDYFPATTAHRHSPQQPVHSVSGPNLLPVSPRRSHSSLPSIGSSTRDGMTTAASFSVPRYLRHASLYEGRFETVPRLLVDEGVPAFDEMSTSLSGKGKGRASLSLALGVGDSMASTSASTSARSSGANNSSSVPPILLPTCWDADDRCSLLEITSDRMGVSFAGSAKYGDRDAAAIRANRPVPPQAGIYYYEVTILDKGVSGYIGIGLSHRTVSLSRLPGWEDKSYGYHADDGRAFCSQGTGEPFGPTFTTGDVIGCGVDWTGAGPPVTDKERSGLRGAAAKEAAANGGGGRAFFTKNGEFIGYAFCNLQGKLYPTVGLRTPNEAVRVDFGNEPFRFDIEGLVLERKRTILSRLASTPLASTTFLPSPAPPIPALLPPTPQDRLHETLQAVISAYLVHHGYAETARAFTEQISEERIERAQGLLPSSAPAAKPSTSASTDSDDLVASIAASSALRNEIRQAALSGTGAERALALVQEHYPTALADDADGRDEDGGVLFRMRCRVFVEKVVEWSRANRDPAAMESDGADNVSMDGVSGAAETITLDSLLALGQSLHAQYSADPRPVVRAELQAVLGLMAYRDPENEATGRTRELVGKAEREKVADELNRAVLRAANLPPVPALEALYRHASATIQLAGDVGCGSAAMVDVRSEVLGDLTGA
ncbi:hypothetical protein JCM10296v2_005770 [Rhodotorula toruloides]